MSVAATLECPPELTTDTTPDWHLAQILHAQHVPLREICARANVGEHALDKRIDRESWVLKRDQSKAIVSVTVKQTGNTQTLTVDVPEPKSQEGSSKLLQRMQKRLDAITGSWDTDKAPKSLIGQTTALELLDKAADIGKTLFGWGQGSTSMAISISNLSSCKLAEPVQPTIDVATVPVLPMVGPGEISTVRDSTQPAGTEQIKHASDSQGQSKT